MLHPPPHNPNMGLFVFVLRVSQQPLLLLILHSLASFLLLQHLLLFSPIPKPTPRTSFSLLIALLPLETYSFHLKLPALEYRQCLQVICGHLSFIILSRSGMALAQGDWVSVKHQDLIEFVLKWVMRGTLLIQSWRPIRLGGLAFPTTCCMLISLCASWVLKDQTASKCDTICQLAFRHAQGHIYMSASCLQDTELRFTLPSQMLYDGCFNTALFATETARLLCIYMRIQCHLIFLCCWSLISNLILQASWMWQHFCHIVMYFLCRPPWDSSTWMWLWWHTIIFPVKGIRMADLLESQWALSPWNRNNNWNGTLALWSRRQCWCVCVCSRVCMVLWLCIKPVAHECLHMCLYGGVGEHLSGATVHLHWLNQIKPTKTNIFVYYLVLDIYRLPSISSSHRWNLSNVMGAIGQVV